jgi:hypothetical protein
MTVIVLRSMPSSRWAGDSLSWLRLCIERLVRFRLLLEAVERCGRPLVLAWEVGVSLLANVLVFSYAEITKPCFLLSCVSATLIARPSA